jgi:hypothetical protein
MKAFPPSPQAVDTARRGRICIATRAGLIRTEKPPGGGSRVQVVARDGIDASGAGQRGPYLAARHVELLASVRASTNA